MLQLFRRQRVWPVVFGVVAMLAVQLALIQTPARAEEDQKVTINFLNGWNGDRIPLLAEVIRRFEARYPWIEVRSQLVEPPTLTENLTVRIVANAAPDVAMISYNDSIRLGREGALRSLASFAEKDDVQLSEYLYPPILEQLTNHPMAGSGNFYYLPQVLGAGWFLFYNIDHFFESGLSLESVPRTWSELEDVAMRLNRPTEGGGFSRLGIDLAMYRYAGSYNHWLNTAGGYSYSEDVRRVVLGEPGTYGIETLEWLVDFTNEVNNGLTTQEAVETSARRGFYSNRFSMLVDGAFSTFQIQNNAPNLNFGMAELPHRDGHDYRPSLELGWGYGIPVNAPHPEEAWLFLKFLTLELDGGGYFMLQQGRPGATFQINNQPGFEEVNSYWPIIQSAINRSTPAPAAPPLMNVDSLLSTMVREAVSGQYSPRAALERAVSVWQAELDAFWASE